MKSRLLEFLLHIAFIAGLVFFIILFYWNIKNIFLTYYIIIMAITLLSYKLLYWYSIKKYQIDNNDIGNTSIIFLKIIVILFTYVSPIYCIVIQPHILVNHYVSLATFVIVFFIALIGIYIDIKLLSKRLKKQNG